MDYSGLFNTSRRIGDAIAARSQENYSTNPIRTMLSDIQARIGVLEASDRQLGMIRATLILNFRSPRCHAGIELAEKPSTLSMLIDLIEAYDKKLQEAVRQDDRIKQDGGMEDGAV